MQLFIDTGDVGQIRKVNDWGILDGITTNPSLVAKTGRTFADVISEVLTFFHGVLNLEVVATKKDDIIAEAKLLAKVGTNTVVKLPTTVDGIAACKILSSEGIRCNMTLCFSVTQALLVAKAGAYYVSPFVGRLDDIGQDGMAVVRDIAQVYENYNFETQILVASVRSVEHVKTAALIGADIATCPYKILEELYQHELTDKGLAKFLEDWKSSGQASIEGTVKKIKH